MIDQLPKYLPNGISVVIPNYNGKQLLEANLPALYNSLELAAVPYEIIVPDDASEDDSLSFLKNNYPEIIIVENVVNRGFAPNINSGIFRARYDLVFLMNSDVKLEGDYFSSQFPYFTKPSTFGVMGRIVGYENDNIQDAAKTQYKHGLIIGANVNLIPTNPAELWFPTLYLSGANALVHREKLMLLQGFDEAYAPFYGEDLDLCMRAWKVGWHCYYHHSVVCRHPNSVTINKYNKKRKIQIIVYRNRFIMHAIHLQALQLLVWNFWIRMQLVFKTLLMQTEFSIAFFQFLKYKNQIRKSRKSLKTLGIETGTVLSNDAVYKLVAGEQDKKGYRKV